MRIKKLMNDSFYVNGEQFSGVTSVSALTSDLFFHYYKLEDLWKLSGASFATASGPILENSSTVGITATIENTGGGTGTYATSLTGVTGSAYYWTKVVNEDSLNVKSECTFDGYSSIVTLNTSKNVRLNTTGTTTINVTHPDVIAAATIPVYIFWPGSISISGYTTPEGTFSGVTGTTYNATAKMDTGGYDITTVCTWISSDPTIATVGLHTGIITCTATPGYTFVTAYYPSGTSAGRAVYSYID